MRLPLIAALLALAAPAGAQTIAQPYRAQGQGWSATINGKQILVALDGEALRRIAMPRPEIGHDDTRYLTSAVLLNASHFPCTDGGGRIWPDTVLLRLDDVPHTGCGGTPVTAPAPPAMLAGEWRIIGLHGRRVSQDTAPFLRFDDEQISGNASCNPFATRFRRERDKLIVEPIAVRHPFCDKRVQNVQEGSVLAMLATPLRASDLHGRLVLSNDAGDTMLLERPRRP